MNSVGWARVAKGVALFAFILPWLTVSCSGQPVLTATGMALATGSRLKVTNPMTGAVEQVSGMPVVWITLALLVIVGCLMASALPNLGRHAAKILLAGAVAAALFSFIGMGSVSSSTQKQKMATRSGASAGQLDAAVLSMITIQTRFGYWLTLLGLAGAAGFSIASLKGRDRLVADVLAEAPKLRVPSFTTSEDDTRFWDGMADKTNPDSLEEYLVRFPNGRFVELARSRLERQGVTPPAAAAAAAAPEAASAAEPVAAAAPVARPADCAKCGAGLEPDSRFCGECGAAVEPAPEPVA